MTEPVCAVTYALVGPLHQIEVSKTCFGYMFKVQQFYVLDSEDQC